MRPMYRMTLFAAMLFTSTYSFAEPSKPISSMMDTPSSVFDVFLFSLFEQSKCASGWFNRTADDDANICMATINYDFNDNLVEMNFVVREGHEEMQDILNSGEEQKEVILKELLLDTAQKAGVEGWGDRGKLGMIQFTSMRHGWGAPSFDEELAKKEISDRTVINLRTNIDGFLYTATRDHHGRVTIEKEKSSILIR